MDSITIKTNRTGAALRIIESDAFGSFTAWGIGFCYEYDGTANRLTIIHARRYRPLINIDVNQSDTGFAAAFVEMFEKTIQTQALMLSNRRTIDVTEIFSEKRLKPYLGGTLQAVVMALHLQQERFQSFNQIFCKAYGLGSLQIAKSQRISTIPPYYEAQILTEKLNKVEAKDNLLHDCLASLARSIISDLIIQETQHNFQSKAYELLSASSNLSTLSMVLDQQFMPRRKMLRRSQDNYAQYA